MLNLTLCDAWLGTSRVRFSTDAKFDTYGCQTEEPPFAIRRQIFFYLLIFCALHEIFCKTILIKKINFHKMSKKNTKDFSEEYP
jgi:hypothetical protein